jgi:hypothetical protein
MVVKANRTTTRRPVNKDLKALARQFQIHNRAQNKSQRTIFHRRSSLCHQKEAETCFLPSVFLPESLWLDCNAARTGIDAPLPTQCRAAADAFGTGL